jgi:hypothetical protein
MGNIDDLLIEEAGKSIADLSESKLSQISQLHAKGVAIAEEIAVLTDKLERLGKESDLIYKKQLPNIMLEVGMTTIKMVTGQTVKLVKNYYASISEANKDKAYAWLDANNLNIVKSSIKLDFDKDSKKEFKAAMALLEEKGLPYSAGRSVHAGTLKATVKEQLEKGLLPAEAQKLLGVYEDYLVTVK